MIDYPSYLKIACFAFFCPLRRTFFAMACGGAALIAAKKRKSRTKEIEGRLVAMKFCECVGILLPRG